jgi:hypothetical protein
MNENCLLGFQCPSCDSCGPFYIEARIVVLVHDPGLDFSNSKIVSDDDSRCKCYSCELSGTVKDFKLEKTERHE